MEHSNDKNIKFRQLIDTVSPGLLRSFLYQTALQDAALYNKVMVCFSPTIDLQEIKLMTQEIDDICYRYNASSGYIKNQDVAACCGDFNDFLENRVKFLIGNQHYLCAFEMICYLFEKLEQQSMEDPHGISSTVANNCYRCWKLILLNVSEPREKEQISLWFQAHEKEYSLDFMGGYLYDFRLYELQDPSLIKKHLKLLDELIEQNRQTGTDCGHLTSSFYGEQNNLVQRIELMKILGMSELDIYEYRRVQWHFSTIRQMAINEYVAHNNLPKAIEVLVESKKRDLAYPDLLSVYSLHLLKLYQKMQMHQAYKEELFYLVTGLPQTDLQMFLQLKQACTKEEWPNIREQIFINLPKGVMLYDIFVIEHLSDRLFQCLEESPDWGLLTRYHNFLESQNPEQLLLLYHKLLLSLAEAARDRKDYQHLKTVLEKAATLPGGKEQTNTLITQWSSQYSGRRMMLEEIQPLLCQEH